MKDDINDLIENIVKKYRNKTISDIKQILGIESNSKNENYLVFKRMLENYNNGELLELFKNKNYVLKTVNFEWNGNLKQSVSLPSFKYNKIVTEKWNSSELREYLYTNSFVFFCMQKNINQKVFKGFHIWKMPITMLDGDVRKTWEETKSIIINGNIVNYIDKRNRYITNFLGKGDTKYIHVRPHARNRYDEIDLPTIDKVTGKSSFSKYSFWLNSSLIKKVLMEGKYND